MMVDDRTGGDRQRWAAGFSLIELLVVVAVLVILIALTVGLANGVLGSGRDRAAQDTIRVLDQSVEAWSTATGDKLPKTYLSVNGTVLDSIDARVAPGDAPVIAELVDYEYVWPSTALYLASISSEADVSAVVTSLDASVRSSRQYSTELAIDDDLTEITDPWGNPIRFVHPAYDGGWGDYLDETTDTLESRDPKRRAFETAGIQFRRSWRPFERDMTTGELPVLGGSVAFGDADEGICPGGGTRAYFYSAGPDGDPGTIEDNVYSERPQFPAETASIRE